MNTTQIILLALAVLATLYELIQVGQLHGIIVRYGAVRISGRWYFAMLAAVTIQVLFVLSLTGNIGGAQ